MNACANHCWVTQLTVTTENLLNQLYETSEVSFETGMEYVPFTLSRLTDVVKGKKENNLWKCASGRFEFKIFLESY